MVMPHNERVGRGLDAVRDGIRPVCEVAWKAAYGDGWLDAVQSHDRGAVGVPNADDLIFLLKGMQNTWQEVWRQRLGQAERAYTSELREARNTWAHQGQFSTDDTYRMLDTAERLLQAFSAVEQLQTVQGLKRDLQRQVFDEQARSERRKTAAKPTDGEPLKGLPPWREIITPHADVASGRFEQAEFAADLYQVATGNADTEYQDPVAFYGRTYLTNGLRELLSGAARRLSGNGGDPVIDLQTNFGGGKTHSMIALYHLASGSKPADLPGIGELFAEQELSIPAKIARAVVVGQWLSATAPTPKPDGTQVHTIWGEIAWQLAGADGYRIVQAEDESGRNPADKLIELFRLAGPSVVLIDEWVRYAAQLPSREGEASLAGGDFDTQFTFAQALTEAAAAVPNVVVLVSIPASDIEVGGERGQDALARLRNVVRRKSAQWKPAEDDESFEIVRRRLFEPISVENARVRDGVIKAFCDYYREKKTEFPSEAGEAQYRRRMQLSYPIHPELFDRLYKDWSTLDRFQRTRGVLRLMATVISVLWQRGDQNLLILPGTIPMDDSRVNSELTKYLDDGWDPVIRSDIDGANALPLRLDQDNRNLGRYSATRRVARAVYLASAPREETRRGIDLKLITLGVAQPGEAPGTFADALRRLSGEATFLYVDGSQYWYSLRANITRLAADRALSNLTDENADDEIKRRLQATGTSGPFVAVHAFPDGPGDVTDDDDGVHLVVLPTTAHHVPSTDDSPAIRMAEQILAQRNAGPRINRNMLVFCAASEARLAELRTATRQHLAWKSILDDQRTEKLDLTKGDEAQARSKAAETDETVTQRIAETYQHVLVPEQTAGTREIRWHQTRPTGAGSLAERIAKKLDGEERLITAYGGTRVRMDLDRVPLWSERRDISVEGLWKAYCQFPYLPRLASFEVLADAIADGVRNMNWQRETFAYAEGNDDTRWVGLVAMQLVTPRRSGFVVAPEVASDQRERDRDQRSDSDGAPQSTYLDGPFDDHAGTDPASIGSMGVADAPALPTAFYGRFGLDNVRAIRQLEDVLRNVVDHLVAAPDASVEITVEINARSGGYDERVRRVVSENAKQLGAQSGEFE
jgi:predicted AAA+ superfamily ATPase